MKTFTQYLAENGLSAGDMLDAPVSPQAAGLGDRMLAASQAKKAPYIQLIQQVYRVSPEWMRSGFAPQVDDFVHKLGADKTQEMIGIGLLVRQGDRFIIKA